MVMIDPSVSQSLESLTELPFVTEAAQDPEYGDISITVELPHEAGEAPYVGYLDFRTVARQGEIDDSLAEIGEDPESSAETVGVIVLDVPKMSATAVVAFIENTPSDDAMTLISWQD